MPHPGIELETCDVFFFYGDVIRLCDAFLTVWGFELGIS
jgi:hypothetical protein